MSYPKEVTSRWLAKYIIDLQYQGLDLGEGTLQCTEKLLEPATTYKLVSLPISSLRYPWPDDAEYSTGEMYISEQYARMNTSFPPIVVTDDNYVIDGAHRIEAAKMRGDTSIQAYIPVQNKTAAFVSIPLGRVIPPYTKVAISVPELVSQTNAFSVKRRPGCNASLMKSDPKHLFLRYNVKCRESYSDPAGHQVSVQFDVDKVEETQNANDLDVRLNCTCPAFLYWGAQWNLHERDGLLDDPRPELVAPTKQKNLRDNFVLCKHAKTVLERILPSVQHNIQNIIREKELAKHKEQETQEPSKLKVRQDEMRKRMELKKLRDRKNKSIQKKLLDALRKREEEEMDEDEVAIDRNKPAVVETPKKEDITREEPEGTEDIMSLLENEEHKLQEQEHKKIKHKKHLHTGLPYETDEEKEEHGHAVPSDDQLIRTLEKPLPTPKKEPTKSEKILKDKQMKKQTSLEIKWLDIIAGGKE